MKQILAAGVLMVATAFAQAQNYNNGEDLSRFVTSEAFGKMSAAELKPIQKKVQAHLDKCVAATVKHLQQDSKSHGVTAAMVQKHYQVWVPYYKTGCEIYAAEHEEEAQSRANLQMRCEVFSQSSFYSNLLAYQHKPLESCQ
ncbi:hypothetical protein ADP71_27030 [Vitreoscilla sp. C1]|uniref:hypothetical protein n=1 Tax=Vitreoscilla sp. (strain C1) TaxID=96942 RepID=UPI000CDC75EC|nr:hypothetical protein [Vitreoscilla sp. C1]AUZ05979.1 hypothetical protein ADP71_27030 [Vitreoscilla sp. C1]